MFARKLRVELVSAQGARACPQKYLDSFAMRGFTGQSRFDETLPVADGEMEASWRAPIAELGPALEDWFRRKGYLRAGESVRVSVAWEPAPPGPAKQAMDEDGDRGGGAGGKGAGRRP